MLAPEELYRFIEREAPGFTEKVRNAARESRNEAEFRTRVTRYIEEVADRLGVDLLLREEYTLATGRADAVYNRFVIEYEPPGSLNEKKSHRHTQHAIQQVKNYIEGLAKKEKHDRNRLLGVAFDGYYYVFVRFHEGHFIVEDPMKVTPTSTEYFLRALFSLSSGRALIPENLVEDFGSKNIYSQRVTRALYHALEGHTDDLTARLFEQWKLFYGEVTGYEAVRGKIVQDKELRVFVRGMGLKPDEVDPPRLFFTIHTFFSFLVKNIARLVLHTYAGGKLGSVPLAKIANLRGEALRRELQSMESGGIFRTLGLKNLLEGDFFAWYLDAWNEEIEEALRLVLKRLAEYNPATIQDDPHSARDLLKKLYHYLLPRKVRHDLGEFYTPDWLAERLLNQLGEPLFIMPEPGAPPLRRIEVKRLLDPACGSGTFLVLAIRALKANCLRAGLSEADTLKIILKSVVGLDLNPLAVLAARVNYLLAIVDLLPYRRDEVEIPVYLADSILMPTQGKDLFEMDRRVLETAVGRLPVPVVIDTRTEMERLTEILEECVRGDFPTDAFLDRCRRELPPIASHPESEFALKELFEHLKNLHSRGLDGIWARVLKNAFMPLFLERFDYVVGNPPWVNWESLPEGYRLATKNLWRFYGLVATKGKGADQFELGKQKRDLSTLMAYVVTDRYLKDGGKLGFLITQSVWKTSANAGFRRFVLPGGVPLRVLHVDDLSKLQVFERATTRTSVFVWLKGSSNRYPVSYTYWQKKRRDRLDYDATLNEVLERTKRLHFQAEPVDTNDLMSPWLTARYKALGAARKVLGKSQYRAHAGVITWANAVYWVEILAERSDGLVVVRNVTEGAKRKVEPVVAEIEPTLLYPLLRGRDVRRWQARPLYQIILPHTPETLWQALSEGVMRRNYTKTWIYLRRFRDLLLRRSGYRLLRSGHPFYILSNVNESTFAPWKVVWTRMGNKIEATVVQKELIPQETLTLVPVTRYDEAHYVCAIINSTLFQFAAYAYSQAGGKSFGSPHLLKYIHVPQYILSNPIHQRLSQLSQRAHELAPRVYQGDEAAQTELCDIEEEINKVAARLWGLSGEELEEIKRSMAELQR